MNTVALAGTFDTKGKEFLYVKKLLEALGMRTLTIHTGVFESEFEPDVTNESVAKAAGYDLRTIVEKRDRSLATKVLADGMEKLIPELYREGKFDGILSFGGSGGTALVTAAMRALPLGVPKIMVSTMASGNVSAYVGTSDIIMMPSIVDIAGINKISEMVFANAAMAMYGMLHGKEMLPEEEEEEKPLVAATMFGVTTRCVTRAKDKLEKNGYEVVVFHATGTGGKTMEQLIRNGFFKGVLDLTTTEWCDEIVGGILAAGEHRSEAAADCGIPQVVSTGAMDMVNFGQPDTSPEKFRGRNFYRHNPDVTLMRTNADENKKLGNKLAEKLNRASGKTVLCIPLKGVSEIDAEGKAFYGPCEDKILFETLEQKVDSSVVEIEKLNCNINDPQFADYAADRLMEMMQTS